MKKLIIVSTLVLIAISMYGQKTITLDFSTKKFIATEIESSNDLETGDFYQVVVSGIDMNLYQVSINKKDTILQTALTVPGFGNFDLGNLEKLISNLSNLGGASAVINSVKETDDKTSDKSGNSFLKAKNVLTIDVNSKKILKDQMKALETSIYLSYRNLINTKFVIDNIKFESNKLLLSYQLKDKKSNAYTSLQSPNAINFQNLNSRINDTRSSLNSQHLSLIDDYNTYNRNIYDYKDVFHDDKNLRKQDSLLRVTYKSFLSVFDSAKTSINASKSADVLNPIIPYENNAGSTYTSLPLQLTKDQSNVTINITPKKAESQLPSYSTTINLPSKSNTFVGISSGFYVSNLSNQAYSTKDSLGFRIISEDNQKFEFGVNAMLRFGFNIKDTKSSVQFGFGPAISISNKVRPRLQLGVGMAHGCKHKFVWDIGGNIGMRDKLSNAFDQKTIYTEKPIDIVVSKLGLGLYASIGYIFVF